MKTMKVICMRGISGAGKSTYAKKLRLEAHERGELPIICSADDFFVGPGGYKFDVNNLDAAHRWCLRSFLQYLQDRMSPVIVDNTNINIEDLAPYVAVGTALGYEVEIIQINTPLTIARGRNVHNTPDSAVEGMYARLTKIKLPNRFKVTHINPS